MTQVRVWDPLVRIFHWSLVLAFLANAFYTRAGKAPHRYVGYAVAGLIAFRLIWGLVGTKHARFADFPPSPTAALGQVSDLVAGRKVIHRGHSPLGALMIYALLALMAGIAASGYAMTTTAYFGVEWVEELHEMLVNLAEACVVVHVTAVVLESRRLGVNLPKAMVTGYKTLRDADP